MEAVILAKTEVPSISREYADKNEELNSEMICHKLDFIEEKRERARIRAANYQHAVAQYYNSKVCIRK